MAQKINEENITTSTTSATPIPLNNPTQSSPPILGGVPAGRGGKITTTLPPC